MEDIVCKLCGTHAAGGEAFCGGCGAFLEWEGERVATEPESALTAGAPGAELVAAPPAATASPAPAAEGSAPSSPSSPAQAVAGSEEHVAKPQPVAVQPAVPLERPKPAPVPRSSRKPDPGAVYCGACGDANAPERRFCRRCGAVLAAPAVVAAVRLPWWKRIFGQRAAATSSNGSGAGGASPPPTAPAATGSPSPGPSTSAPKMPSAPKAPVAFSHSGSPSGYRPPSVPSVPRSITPPGLPKRGGKVGKSLLVLVLLAVVVFAAVPPLRHKVTSLWDNIVTKPAPVALAGAVASNHGACAPALLGQNNATLYWYTHPADTGPESVTVSVAPSFTGSVSSIVFTPLIANPSTTLAGRPSPHPVVIRLVATPSDTATTIRLQNPPKLQAVTVSLPRPATMTLTLISTDPGSAPSSCAETGIVFEGKS